MNVGSLFSGIGGFDLGLERAGMRVVWQCEADEFCRRVLAKHWPDVPCYHDVRELRGADVEPVDVLCGGFPCQDISLAGKGAGIDGARSGLWGEYARLIRELRPRYVIVENVAALRSRGLDQVLGDLAARGYDAEWDCIPASAVGAPHRRDRLWLVAYPDGSGREPRFADLQARQPDAQGCCGDVAHADEDGRREGLREPARRDERPGPGDALRSGERPCDVPDADDEGEHGLAADAAVAGAPEPLPDADECAVQPWRVGGRAAQAGGPEWWAVEPPVGRVAHGVPDRLAQLAALGNALVPQIPELIGRAILEHETAELTSGVAA